MAAAKEWCAIVLDVGAAMSSAVRRATGHTHEAVRAVQMLLVQKMLYSKKDDVFVILVGTPETDNSLHTPGEPFYTHVCEYTHTLAPANVELVRRLGSVPDYTGNAEADGDVVDGIILAAAKLGAAPKYKPGNGRIVVVTCAQGRVAEPEQVADILPELDRLGVKLDVFGVGFAAFEEGGERASAPEGSKEAVLMSLVEARRGYLLPVTTALGMMKLLRTVGVNQVTKFRGELDIAGVVGVPIWTYSHTMEAKPQSLKRMPATLAGAAGAAASGAAAEEEGVEASSSGYGVKFERRYRRTDTEAGEEVDKTELVKAYRYGRDMVIVSPEDEDLLKWDHERELVVLAFSAVDDIPRFVVMSTVDVVVPAPGDVQAAAGVSALARALANTERVALVRYVKRKGSAPVLGILVPALAEPRPADASASVFQREFVIRPSPVGIDCLYFIPLPFADDIRPYRFIAFQDEERFKPTAEQLAAADNLITALDLTAVPDGHGGHYEALQPTSIFNPVLARFHAALAARALDPSAPLPPVDPAIDAYMRPNAALFAQAEKVLSAFKLAMGPALKRNPKTDLLGTRRLFLEQAAGESGVAAAAGTKRRGRKPVEDAAGEPVGEPVKRAREGDEKITAAVSWSAIARWTSPSMPPRTVLQALFGGDENRQRVSKISTATPVEDFRAMLARRDMDMTVPAVLQLASVIESLAADALSVEKARDCLAELRVGCLTNGEEGRFNAIITSLRDRHGPGAAGGLGDEFWRRVVNAGISLISREESPNSDVPDDEKRAFLSYTPAHTHTHTHTHASSHPPSVLDLEDIE